MLPSIYAPNMYIHTYVHEHTPLAKPGFCSGERTSCKPNNGALLRTSTNKIMIIKVLDTQALPLAVIIVTFIVQLAKNVTMIATMVIIIKIRKRTIKLVRVIVTATVKEIVAIMTMIMIVILIVLVAAIVSNLILVQGMRVVIVVSAALSITNHGSSNGSNNRISAHTTI